MFIFASFGILNVLAEETEEKQYTTANNVAVHTVFKFRAGVEESDGFQVYEQMSGFDRSLESPAFKLEGVMDFDRPHLYEAADTEYLRGVGETQHKYGQFDVDVYLHKDGQTLRHFKYGDCSVSDYKVVTLFDKEEGWTTSKGFAIIDEFEFECSGYSPNNPIYDVMFNVEKANTPNSFDLKNTDQWGSGFTVQ